MALFSRSWMVSFIFPPTAASCRFYSITSSCLQKPRHLVAWGIDSLPLVSRNISLGSGASLPSLQPLIPAWANKSRKSVVNQICRHHSVLSRPAVKSFYRRPQSLVFVQPHSRSFHLSTSVRYDRLQNLEDAANRDRDNANAQAVFLQVKVLPTPYAK
jgi:hypothetical protein